MKRLLILLMLASPAFGHDYTLYHPNVPAPRMIELDPPQTNTFCASNLTCTVSAAWTFSSNLTVSGTGTLPNVDNQLFVEGITYPRTCAGLNSAIQAAPVGSASNNPNPSGSIIYLGYGDIPCSVTVLIDRPITLRGSGFAGRLVPQAGFAGPVIKADCSNGKGAVNQFGACIGSRLENIWIEDTAFRSQNTDGIWLIHQDEFMMYNVEVKWLKGYALQLDNNGNNNTPVRESVFRNFVSWGNGDPAQSKASIMLITNSFSGSDEINEIRFVGGGVKNEWWEAVRIGTGQTASIGAPLGPRHIYFDNFQLEARQDLDCAGGQCVGGVPPAVAPFSDNVHIVQANNVSFHHSSASNAGQGKSSIRIDGTTNNPVQLVELTDMVIGGNPSLTGFLTCTNVANSVCTWVSGNQFLPFDSNSWVGLTISIPAAACTASCVVSSIQSATQITLTTNTGTITNTAYTVTSGGFGVTGQFVSALKMSGVRWLTNPNGNLNTTIPNTNNYTITELPGFGSSITGNVFGVQQCVGTDCSFGLKNNTSPNGQTWSFDSKSDGTGAINPQGGNGLLPFQVGGTLQALNGVRFAETAVGNVLGGAGFGEIYEDSTSHLLQAKVNGGSLFSLGQTLNASQGLYQSKRGVAGCTTAASIGGTCATDITVTWTTAFPDANYSVTCMGSTPTAVPAAPFVVSGTKLAATVHINYFAITAVAASYATIDCVAIHD